MHVVKLGLALVFALGSTTYGQTPSPTPTPAATPPASDIYIVDLKIKHSYKTHADEITLGDPKRITDFAGYNNQPSFMPDGKSILYTSIRDKQADIYRYDIQTGATTRVTNTPESEYSPTLMPDRKNISVVRVESDGTQRLWKFPLDGGPPSLVIEDIKPVGYHLWIDDHTLALFVLGGTGKPNFLELYDLTSHKSEFIAENPGRVLRRIPNQEKFSFVQKIAPDHWEIKAFDLRTRTSSSLTRTLPGVEDYAWLPGGLLLMGKESKLFTVLPLEGKNWSQLEDFTVPGLQGISRITVSPKGDRLAIVARH